MKTMTENFESTYESAIPKSKKNELYDDFELPLPEVVTIGSVNNSSPDALIFGSQLPGGLGNDHISVNSTFDIKMPEDTNKNGFWKYEEDKTLKEIEQYLSSTYHSHYTSEQSKTQTLDLIESIGDAEAFTRSNAIKYLSRFGKKNGKSKMDILKAIHYCILLYHFAGLHKNTTSDFPY